MAGNRSLTMASGAAAPGGAPAPPPPPEKTSSRLKRLFTLKKKPKELPPAALSGASDSELQEGPAAVPSGRIQTMGRAPSMGRSGSAIGGDAVVDAKEECGTITVKVGVWGDSGVGWRWRRG